MRLHLYVDKAVAFLDIRRLLALFLTDGVAQQLDVHIVADVLHMAVLLGAEDVACTAQLEVAHGYLEA